MHRANLRVLLILLVILTGSDVLWAQATRPASAIRHVLIISVDGLRPDLLLRADAPNMRRFLTEGAFSLWARTTAHSTTLPSHMSMLTGVTPEVHGITWNGDMPFKEPVYSAAPTLFKLAKKAGLTTAVCAGKSKFDILDEPGVLDWKWISPQSGIEDTKVAEQAIPMLRDHLPNVMFVHFASVDGAGHGKGWGSPEQLKVVAEADGYIGQLLQVLDDTGMRRSTLVIISADHGGAGKTHGPDDPRSRTIPWLLSGPGVRAGYDLTRLGRDHDVQTYDTFATACAVLNIRPDRRITGKFVREAFDADLIESAAATQPTPTEK